MSSRHTNADVGKIMTYTHLIAFEGRSVTLGRQMAIVLVIAVLIGGCVILALKRKSHGNETSPKQPANATATATVTVPIQIKVSFGHSDEEESDPAEIDPASLIMLLSTGSINCVRQIAHS
jgi:hypothetical protein